MPHFDSLWTNFILQETQLESRNGKQKGSSDENQTLVSRASKGRKGGSPQREAYPETKRKKDLSKFKCFSCHEYGHWLHSVHNGGKGEGGSRHQQRRLMRL